LAIAKAREFPIGGSTLLQRIFSRPPLPPFAVAASGLAVAAFLLAFSAGRVTGPARPSPPELQPLRAPVAGLVLPHLSELPALPTLAEPASKPKPVAALRLRTAKPAQTRRPQPQPKTTPAAKRTPARPAPKPVVIVGNG
jgi:hypothetical protein